MQTEQVLCWSGNYKQIIVQDLVQTKKQWSFCERNARLVFTIFSDQH